MHKRGVPWAASGLCNLNCRSFLLPCPLCGHRMAITSVTPLAFADHGELADLEDVTHSCVPCGAAVIRTIRSTYGDAHTIAHRV